MTITLNTVRYYTSSDVYHYTSDNRPIQDLASNDVILQGAIVRNTRVTTADQGNTSPTVQAAGYVTVFYNTPITTNQVVTLNTTNPVDGDTVRVVRTAAATGASTLTVSATGSISKVLAAGQWVDYQFWGTGSAIWMETASGSL